MRVTIFISLLALAPILGQAFTFTSPPTSQKLNLSAPIELVWQEGKRNGDASYTEFDLWFWGGFASGGEFGYELEQNITLVDEGSYVWDPKNQTDALRSVPNTITSKKAFYFEVRVHAANESRGARERSEKYAVTGYELVGAGSKVTAAWGVILGGLAVALLS
ncbi:hypothetical protein CMUS01_13903 [Colletotrichum musicola]|uniref:Uncharacterized protein n=1 Tax=Colletotrichum musicola TaxID=2175873 RepID=A0A8H6J8E0_9PEZI|nr:hypothetical protein CMUS01_13903 [Colletotrichum musicola]